MPHTISINTGFLKTAPGLLKLLETAIGATCLGLNANFGFVTTHYVANREQTYFFLVTFAFMVTTFLLVISAIVSSDAATALPKTVFETFYHLFAFVFYLSASVVFLMSVAEMHKVVQNQSTRGRLTAAGLGLVNSVLYLLSTFFSFRAYRSG